MGMIDPAIRAAIQANAAHLQSAGLRSLYLFGSQARGDSRPGSDIDLLFEAADDDAFSLLDQARLQLELEAILSSNVDLVERQALRPRMRAQVEREMVRLL